jgi:ABC-type proline/glycine betaine transport system permease subunit
MSAHTLLVGGLCVLALAIVVCAILDGLRAWRAK